MDFLEIGPIDSTSIPARTIRRDKGVSVPQVLLTFYFAIFVIILICSSVSNAYPTFAGNTFSVQLYIQHQSALILV